MPFLARSEGDHAIDPDTAPCLNSNSLYISPEQGIQGWRGDTTQIATRDTRADFGHKSKTGRISEISETRHIP